MPSFLILLLDNVRGWLGTARSLGKNPSRGDCQVFSRELAEVEQASREIGR